MNRIDLPPGSSVRVGRSDGNLDQVLGAYFKSELPAEWPALHLPHSARIAAPSATHKSAGAVRSRLALAASVGGFSDCADQNPLVSKPGLSQ